MSDVVLFHHAQGLTDGVQTFAEQLRTAGHRVTVPDLDDGTGRRFTDSSLTEYDPASAAHVMERTLQVLDRWR
jgi:dienelactone hydrolase